MKGQPVIAPRFECGTPEYERVLPSRSRRLVLLQWDTSFASTQKKKTSFRQDETIKCFGLNNKTQCLSLSYLLLHREYYLYLLSSLTRLIKLTDTFIFSNYCYKVLKLRVYFCLKPDSLLSYYKFLTWLAHSDLSFRQYEIRQNSIHNFKPYTSRARC